MLHSVAIFSVSMLVITSRIDAALVAYYGFEEGAGNDVYDAALADGTATPDDSGVIVGAATYVTGVVGDHALSFDGMGAFVRAGNVLGAHDMLNAAPGVTFAMWAKINALPSDVASLAFGSVSFNSLNSGAVIDVTSSGRLEVAGRSFDFDRFQSRITESVLALDEWHHLAGVIDYPNGEISIYFDGVLQPLLPGSVAFSGTSSANINSASITLGSTGGFFEFFNGTLDDVRIYNEALSGEQIAALAVPEPSRTILVFAGFSIVGIRRRFMQRGM
jgi:hypothetical protein